MVLEKIVSIREAIRRPWWMFIIGGIVSVICLFISLLVFPHSIGMFTAFLITFAMTPFMINLITYEEAKEEELIERRKEVNLFQAHKEILLVYSAFFSGMILFMSIIFLMLPEDTVQKLFEDQISEINLIRGSAVFANTLQRIIFNNIGVLLLAFLLSFLFGAGAIFILSWNASVLATAIGLTAKTIGGVKGLPLALMLYFPHGSLEILAYFIGGIAGGLVSAAITRRKSKWFWFVVKDSIIFLLIAVIILIGAGLIESTSIAISK